MKKNRDIESLFYLKDQSSAPAILSLTAPSRAYLFESNNVRNLLTAQRSLPAGISDLLHDLGSLKKLICDKNFHVLHLSYDVGLDLHHISSPKKSSDKLTKAIYLKFSKHRIQKMSAMEKKTPPKIKLVEKNKINFDWYKNAFEKGFNHLQKGNCYQFNLTAPFVYQLQQSTNEKWKNSFFQSTVGKSAFAHSTFLGDGGPILYSNSPECLFQVKQGPNDCVYIQSMPIKGTVKIEKNQLHKLWQKMQSDEKNRAELSMITDLMANDLSRIQFPNAKVISTSVPLLVPGLMHQYSIVESIVDSNVSLKHVIQAMFPGGSITGAPKIKAMEILHQLEMAPRGFYCGSTLLAGRGMLAACINIRTAWINDGQQSMQVGAGGGITIRSNIQEEWQEMLAKRDSFLNFLQKTGCFEII